MNPKRLASNYAHRKEEFFAFLDTLKRKMPRDVYSIVNPTVVANPYMSEFPLRFFLQERRQTAKIALVVRFIWMSLRFYCKQAVSLASYMAGHILYAITYKRFKTRQIDASVGFDIFILVDEVIKNEAFFEKYCKGVYDVFAKEDRAYMFLVRLYNEGKNPWKLKKFFDIARRYDFPFLFEYDILQKRDYLHFVRLIAAYPLKTLRLLRKDGEAFAEVFNRELVFDLANVSFESLSRYIFGINLARTHKGLERIYSWSEFQAIERGFNFAIRSYAPNIRLIACELFINYETYFNTYVRHSDAQAGYAPHEVLVNGRYYVSWHQHKCRLGVSLRYDKVFTFEGIKEERDILVLGSHIVSDTQNILREIRGMKSVVFKKHPASKPEPFFDFLDGITLVDEDIYTLFRNAKIVITTASGSALEAVACGLSVVIVASRDKLTANPLVKEGQGVIWDIAYNAEDIAEKIETLLLVRQEQAGAIRKTALWYKENFFVEPTQEKIREVFS